MRRQAYYRVKGEIAHWVPTCSRWPVDDYEIAHSPPPETNLCPECDLREQMIKGRERDTRRT
jgi:hypothetical protein